jgi:hypothetical protein
VPNIGGGNRAGHALESRAFTIRVPSVASGEVCTRLARGPQNANLPKGIPMKLWVDDLRPAPDTSWTWAETSADAIAILSLRRFSRRPVEAMSLDHDLGEDDTTRGVVLWMCENEFWPEKIFVHTQNPVGRDWLEGMIKRYKPEETV